jgi:hypothetical protein
MILLKLLLTVSAITLSYLHREDIYLSVGYLVLGGKTVMLDTLLRLIMSPPFDYHFTFVFRRLLQ